MFPSFEPSLLRWALSREIHQAERQVDPYLAWPVQRIAENPDVRGSSASARRRAQPSSLPKRDHRAASAPCISRRFPRRGTCKKARARAPASVSVRMIWFPRSIKDHWLFCISTTPKIRAVESFTRNAPLQDRNKRYSRFREDQHVLMLSASIFRHECRCAGVRGSPTLRAKSLRIIAQRSPSGSRSTTSAAFTKRCAALQRWR